MATSNSVAGFKASVDGLHFTNSFPHVADFELDFGPLGKMPIGDAANGLCGGMVYTVMDVFNAGLAPIPDTQLPAQGSPLFNYVVARLIASFDIPAGVLKYYEWMNTPDHDTGIWFLTRRGVSWKTIMEEWPRIKADIDAGMLSPLALVTVYTTDPTMMGHNHQVLAYAYEVDDANVLTLRLYDPNTASTAADDVFLSVDLSNPTHTSPITHNVGIGDLPIRGFFRTAYAFNDPAALEPTPPLASNALYVTAHVPSPLMPGQVAQADVTMQNLGGTTWTSGGSNPFRLGSQDPQDGTTWGINRVELPHDVAPGEQVTFTFSITAPTAPGTYRFQWRMVQELVTWFGDFTSDLPVVVPSVLKPMSASIAPSPTPIRRAVMVTITATDDATHAAVPGTVKVDGVVRGVTGTPFSLTIPVHRVRGAGGDWDWEPTLPHVTVEAPGYHPVAVPIEVDA